MFGATGEIRTPDSQVRSLVLYPTELRSHSKTHLVLPSRVGLAFSANIVFHYVCFRMPCIATRHDRVHTLPSDFSLYVIAIDFILLSAHSIHFALYYGSRCLFTLSSISVSQLVNFLSSLMMDSSTFKFIFYQLCYLLLRQNMIAKPITFCFRSFVLYLFIHLLSNPLCKSKNP